MKPSESGSILSLRDSRQWNALPIDERRRHLSQDMIALLEELLAQSFGAGILQYPLRNLEIDSLQAFEIESEWEVRTGIKLNVVDYMSEGTVADLVEAMLRDDSVAAAQARIAGDERDVSA